jgi:hypothetical protein
MNTTVLILSFVLGSIYVWRADGLTLWGSPLLFAGHVCGFAATAAPFSRALTGVAEWIDFAILAGGAVALFLLRVACKRKLCQRYFRPDAGK